jgi:hypothetical protein
MEREFDPYEGSIPVQSPAPHGPQEDHSGGCIEQQIEIARRSLAYRGRFNRPDTSEDIERFAETERGAGGK